MKLPKWLKNILYITPKIDEVDDEPEENIDADLSLAFQKVSDDLDRYPAGEWKMDARSALEFSHPKLSYVIFLTFYAGEYSVGIKGLPNFHKYDRARQLYFKFQQQREKYRISQEREQERVAIERLLQNKPLI